MPTDPNDGGSQLPAHPAYGARMAAAPPAAPAAPAQPQLLGQGLALEAVSQAAAMAVQDAGTYFRQVTAVSAAAVAAFTAKMAETQSPTPWTDLITAVNTNVTNAGTVFSQVGADAASVIKAFSNPSGSN